MKHIAIVLMSIFFLTGCNYKQLQELKDENVEQEMKINELQSKLDAQRKFVEEFEEKYDALVQKEEDVVEVYKPKTLTCGEHVQVIKIDEERGWMYMQWGEDLKQQSDPLYYKEKIARNTLRLEKEDKIRFLSVETCSPNEQACTLQCVDVLKE